MFDPHRQKVAPDYTPACIVMFGVNLVWMLFLVWAIWGLIAAGLAGWIVHKLIDRIDVRTR